MKLHDILKTMPGTELVQIVSSDEETLFSGTAHEALERLEDEHIFTLFALDDVLYIFSLED